MPLTSDAPAIVNVLILDKNGGRVSSKYFTDRFSTPAQQLSYEKSLYTKASKQPSTTDAEIIIFEGLVTVYKSQGEITFFVTGDQDENEIILVNVLNALVEACTKLIHGNLDSHSMLQNLDSVCLVMDELVDGGVILEIDGSAIASRVSMKSSEGEVPLHEQTPRQAFSTLREHLTRSIPILK